MLAKQLQDSLKMLQMLSLSSAIHHNIIQVDQHKLGKMLTKNIIHDRLESGGRIAQPKAQHCVLKQAKGSGERSLWQVPRLEPVLMLCSLQIDAGKDRCTLLVKQVINARQGISVRDGMLAQCTM